MQASGFVFGLKQRAVLSQVYVVGSDDGSRRRVLVLFVDHVLLSLHVLVVLRQTEVVARQVFARVV